MDRARIAYASLQRRFPLDESVFVWPYGQVLEAAIAVGDEPGINDLVRELERYWNGRAYRSGIHGGDVFYDDNAWLGLALFRIGRVEAAARVFQFVTGGWDARRGGVYWTDGKNRDRNTVSTAPNGQLAMHLHSVTGREEYREWAQRMHDWVDATLRDPSDGLYWDRVDDTGAIEKTKWSYNQGCMAGLKAALGMRADADAIVQDTLPRLAGQPLAFNAIFFRNALERGLGRPELASYAATLATEYDDLLDHAAAVQLLALAA